MEDHLLPAADAWAEGKVTVTLGEATTVDGRVRLPVVLLNPPSGGLGAFDVTVHVDRATARVVAASAAVGAGDEVVDAANGTARIASFDAQALLAVGSAAKGFEVLAFVTLEPLVEGATPVRVEVVELVDRDGRDVPVVSPDADVHLTRTATAGGIPRWLPLAGVAVLGGGVAWGARRWLSP